MALNNLAHHKWLHVSKDRSQDYWLFGSFSLAVNGFSHFFVKAFQEPVVPSDAATVGIPRCEPRIREFSIPLEVSAAAVQTDLHNDNSCKLWKCYVMFIGPWNTEELSWTCHKVFLHCFWIRIWSAGFKKGGKWLRLMVHVILCVWCTLMLCKINVFPETKIYYKLHQQENRAGRGWVYL